MVLMLKSTRRFQMRCVNDTRPYLPLRCHLSDSTQTFQNGPPMELTFEALDEILADSSDDFILVELLRTKSYSFQSEQHWVFME